LQKVKDLIVERWNAECKIEYDKFRERIETKRKVARESVNKEYPDNDDKVAFKVVAAARRDHLSYVSIPLLPILPGHSSVIHYISKGSHICIEFSGDEDVMELRSAQVMECCLVDRKTDESFFKVRKFARSHELPPRRTARYDWPLEFKPREHLLLKESTATMPTRLVSIWFALTYFGSSLIRGEWLV
jgi:hypothetical protein